jgi:putative addiction module CopG family antidote
MNVTLPAALEEFIRRKVAAGDFSSVDEMVAEGLRVLQQQEEQWAAESRRKIDEGWDQAQAGQSRTIEEARTSLAERKAAWKKAQSERE